MTNLNAHIKRGEIWRYKTNKGTELGLVVSNNIGNKNATIVTIARIKEWNEDRKDELLATRKVYTLKNKKIQKSTLLICFEQQMTCAEERLIEKIEEAKINVDYFLGLLYLPNALKDESFPVYHTGIRQFDSYRLPAKGILGSEQGGERIVYVISNNVLNEAGYVLVVPITSKRKPIMPTHVFLSKYATSLEKHSTLMAEHIKYLPLSEFIKAEKLTPLAQKYHKPVLEAAYIASARVSDVIKKTVEQKNERKKRTINRR